MKKLLQSTMIALLVTGNVYSQSQKETGKIYPGSNSNQKAMTGGINLLSPANGQAFNNTSGSKPILFRWSAQVPKPKESVTYRLKVWQLMQGQNSTEAMRSNHPIVTKDVDNITQAVVNNIYTGPCKPPYLCDFVWAVECYAEDRLIAKSTVTGGVNTFSYTGGIGTVTGSGGATIDLKRLDKELDKMQPGTKAQGDPVHGVDVKLGVKSVITQGDPAPGLGLNGLPPGVPWVVPPGIAKEKASAESTTIKK